MALALEKTLVGVGLSVGSADWVVIVGTVAKNLFLGVFLGRFLFLQHLILAQLNALSLVRNLGFLASGQTLVGVRHSIQTAHLLHLIRTLANPMALRDWLWLITLSLIPQRHSVALHETGVIVGLSVSPTDCLITLRTIAIGVAFTRKLHRLMLALH